MSPAQQVYRFTVYPSPDAYPASEVDAIGTFSVVVPAERTLGELFEDMGDEFPFEVPCLAMAADKSNALGEDTPIGGIGLAIGEELFLTNYVDWLMRLDFISLVSGPVGERAVFDLTGFDADRMQEAAEDANADPDGEETDEPVYRVQFQTGLAHEARGKSITSTRDMRWKGRLPLGILATAAIEGSDGLLDASDLILSVCPTRSTEGWLNYAGGDYEKWAKTCIDELGIDPIPIPVGGPDPDIEGREIRGWTVLVRPPESGEVTGVVRMVVISNGDYWKFRSLLPDSLS